MAEPLTPELLDRMVEEATPGPWEADAYDEGLDVRAPEHAVARIAGPWTMSDPSTPEIKTRALADARLIALAPTLAAKLAEAMRALGELHEQTCGCAEPGKLGVCVAHYRAEGIEPFKVLASIREVEA